MTYWVHKHAKFCWNLAGSGGVCVDKTFLWSIFSALKKPGGQSVVLEIGWLKFYSSLDYAGNLIGLSISTFSHSQSTSRETVVINL